MGGDKPVLNAQLGFLTIDQFVEGLIDDSDPFVFLFDLGNGPSMNDFRKPGILRVIEFPAKF
jgi:hypothetical protein